MDHGIVRELVGGNVVHRIECTAAGARALMWFLSTRLRLGLLGCAALAVHPGAGLAQTPVLPLHEVFRTGGDFAPSETAFGYISDVAVSKDGQIFVLDSQAGRMVILDRAGQFVRSVGRDGAGPGEFQVPIRVQVDSQVVVFDARLQRSSTFKLSGRHVRTEPFPAPRGVALADAAESGTGIVARTPNMFNRSVPPERDGMVAVVFASSDGMDIDTLATYKAGYSLWSTDRAWSLAVAPTGHGGAWIAFSDTIVTVNGISGDVRWYSTGAGLRLEREGNIGLRGRPVSEADIEQFKEALLRDDPRLPPNVELHPPAHWSVATELVYGDALLWIRNGTDQVNGDLYTSYDPRTGATQRWRLPKGFRLLAVDGGRFYGRKLTENDAQMVVVYELRR